MRHLFTWPIGQYTLATGMTTVSLTRKTARRRPGGPSARALASVLVSWLAAGSCAPGDARTSDGVARAAGAPVAAGAAEIASPARPGSGQPFLDPAPGGVWMSWTEPAPSGHRVAASFFDGSGWSPPSTVAEGDRFFVNWADFPSIRAFGDLLVAHWLWRGGQATYDYGVRLSWSTDGGATWAEPWTPHDDGTPTEHGFVSIFENGGAVWAAWLDGRAMVTPGGPMSLRARSLPVTRRAAGAGSTPAGSTINGSARAGAPAHVAGPETLVDERSCECCQTDAALAAGVGVLVYRDRAEGEVRDISASRLTDSGWSDPVSVHDDGWVIGGCPVNGPAVAARGESVAVAWFTAPQGRPRVNVAFSSDGAATFGPPARIDAGQPAGRVDVVMLDDGSALVSWIERTAAGAQILSRRAAAGGDVGETVPLADTDSGRAAGFPRIARLGPGRLMLAWTDPDGVGRVRVAVFPLDAWDPSP